MNGGRYQVAAVVFSPFGDFHDFPEGFTDSHGFTRGPINLIQLAIGYESAETLLPTFEPTWDTLQSF
jgi:hypothetical protein